MTDSRWQAPKLNDTRFVYEKHSEKKCVIEPTWTSSDGGHTPTSTPRRSTSWPTSRHTSGVATPATWGESSCFVSSAWSNTMGGQRPDHPRQSHPRKGIRTHKEFQIKLVERVHYMSRGSKRTMGGRGSPSNFRNHENKCIFNKHIIKVVVFKISSKAIVNNS